MENIAPSKRVYRLDKFTVPDAARGEFLSRVQETHDLLKAQAGFVQDFLLEQPANPGAFTFVRLVEWEDPEAIESARVAVKALHERTNFTATCIKRDAMRS